MNSKDIPQYDELFKVTLPGNYLKQTWISGVLFQNQLMTQLGSCLAMDVSGTYYTQLRWLYHIFHGLPTK